MKESIHVGVQGYVGSVCISLLVHCKPEASLEMSSDKWHHFLKKGNLDTRIQQMKVEMGEM